MCELAEAKVVRVTQRREANAKVVVVGPTQRMEASHSHKVEVVVETYQVADRVVRIQTAGRIGEKHGLASEYTANAYGECDGGHVVPFVETGNETIIRNVARAFKGRCMDEVAI